MGFLIGELLDAGLLHGDVTTNAGSGLARYREEPWLDGDKLEWCAVPTNSHDESALVPTARALVAGEIRVLDVTLHTPVALDAVRAIAQQVPDAIVGVGTVTQVKHFESAKQAGAKFAVTPGLTHELARAADAFAMPLLPGVMTPSDIIAATNEGYTALKFFPAADAGGTTILEAFAGPFTEVVFCPTGGISLASAADYLALSNVKCVGGSWLTPKALMDAQD